MSEVKFFDIITLEETNFDLLLVEEIRTDCLTVDWRNIETNEIEETEEIYICVVVLLDGRIVASTPSNDSGEIYAIGDALAIMCRTALMQASAHLN